MKIFHFLMMLILVSCNTYNDKMNRLLNLKSTVEQKLDSAIYNENLYNRKAESMLLNYDGSIKGEPPPPSTIDLDDDTFDEYSLKNIERIKMQNKIAEESNEYKMYMDTIKIYKILKLLSEYELKNINYSIDSLSKLK